MLTTVHGPCYSIDDYMIRNRRRPRKTSRNGSVVQRAFGDLPRKDLPIPQFIDDYNQNMNGVDRADQLRQSMDSHRVSSRNWLPMLWWLFDITKINAYLLYRYQYEEKEGRFDEDLPEKILTHRQFQEELAL